MRDNECVILPDGSLDFDYPGEIPADVPLIPIEIGNATRRAMAEPEGEEVGANRLAKLLETGRGVTRIKRGKPGEPGLYRFTYRCVSGDREVQMRYEEMRRAGLAHESAQSNALSRNRHDKDGRLYRVVRVSDDPAIQDRYIAMRDDGQSHNLAECLALRAFPGIKTDSIFNEGRCNGNQFEKCPLEGDWLRGKAEAAGVSTTGKFYCRGLAEFPGDPEAWIADRGDALRVAAQKGLKVSGYVDYTPPERPPIADMMIDPAIIDAEVADILDENPGLRADDVREKVHQLRSGAIDPNPLRVQEPTDELPAE